MELISATAGEPLLNAPPQGKARMGANICIVLFLLANVLIPLRYYLVEPYETNERFAWRMFSSVHMRQNRRLKVTEVVEQDGKFVERPTPLTQLLQQSWINALLGGQTDIVENFLRWRVAQPGVVSVSYELLSLLPAEILRPLFVCQSTEKLNKFCMVRGTYELVESALAPACGSRTSLLVCQGFVAYRRHRLVNADECAWFSLWARQLLHGPIPVDRRHSSPAELHVLHRSAGRNKFPRLLECIRRIHTPRPGAVDDHLHIQLDDEPSR